MAERGHDLLLAPTRGHREKKDRGDESFTNHLDYQRLRRDPGHALLGPFAFKRRHLPFQMYLRGSVPASVRRPGRRMPPQVRHAASKFAKLKPN